METVNPYSFIHIGLDIRALRHCSGLSRSFVIEEGEKLTENLKGVGFQVSSVGISQLANFILKIRQLPQTTLEQNETEELTRIMTAIENMVWAEALTKSIFVVSGGRYSLEILMNQPEKMFTMGIFSGLPELIKYDLTEGFLCLVFSRATASAFHILRATEGVLKELYFILVKKNREKNPMWGNMVVALRKKRNIDQNLLDRLDYIRTNYRNPTNHPLNTYSINDTENLLGLCIEVIERMFSYFPKR